MKIAFVEPHLGLYGGIRRILEFANRFVDRGEDVTVFHPQGTACTWMECRARVLPTSELFRASFDVVVFNDPPDYRLVRRARARLKVFYILELYEKDRLREWNPKIVWPRKGRTLSLKRALQMPFLMVANATWIQRWLADNLSLESELVLGGVNRELFHPVAGARAPSDAFVVLCSGDPREHKGTRTVTDAIERVRFAHPRVVLETYHGRGIPQSEMAACYARADLFVDAQWHAGWNNPVVEAMACGTPVVCSDIGGVADFAFHERTALVVAPRDVDGFASAIARMIDSPALRAALAANALREVDRFDWDAAVERFLSLLYATRGAARAPAGTA
ncbi:MAG TPA: glycosyltransferase family 4 protein [Candidatus Krumholzibacteria bacterium]|nr:glycosyltransferase family 4 protein [Candidatus Krumholzibacteria bacterium]